MPNKTLLVIIPDRLSDLIAKGEYIARYYNPGNLFDTVHILMTNNDHVDDPAPVQSMVGDARLYVHNLPIPRFSRSLGWQPFMLRSWVAQGVKLAQQIEPSLIRTYSNTPNGYLAAQIKKHLGLPLVVSLHDPTHPDPTHLDQSRGMIPRHRLRARLRAWRYIMFEEATLKAADWVLPVYESIVSYARRRGAKRVKVCYNMINNQVQRKSEYALHEPPRIISVGRQFLSKNPDNLIRAVARLDAHLTLVGDGPYHDRLRAVAQECSIAGRVSFHKAIPNAALCRMLPDFDIFATHTEYAEISKAVLEPLLSGLPTVINRRIGQPVPELQGDWVTLVENSVDGYYDALHHLLSEHTAREALGRRAYAHAQARYAPEKTESVFVDIYRTLVPGL